MIKVNAIGKEYYDQLMESILTAKSDDGLKKFDSIMLKRKEWIENYTEEDKRELLQWILEKDKEITRVLQEKMETLRHQISQEEQFNRNRGTFKLYE